MKWSRKINIVLTVGMILILGFVLMESFQKEQTDSNWVTIILVVFLGLLYFMTRRSRKRFEEKYLNQEDNEEND